MKQITLKNMPRTLLALFLSFSLVTSGCSLPENQEEPVMEQSTDAAFSTFCDNLFRETASRNTLDLHYLLQDPSRFSIPPASPGLGSFSLVSMIQSDKRMEDCYQEFLGFDRALLSEENRLLYDVLGDMFETEKLCHGLELYAEPLSPTIGIQAQLPVLLAEYSFHDLKDVTDYLSLLEDMDRYYGEILTFEQQRADAGLGPSDEAIDGILTSLKSYELDPEDNFLTASFARRLSSLDLSEEQKKTLTDRHLAALTEHFLPACHLLYKGMEDLKGHGTGNGGLCRLRHGKRYYEYLLRSGPGISSSVPELKKLLNRQIQSELNVLTKLYQKYPDMDLDAVPVLTDPATILHDLKDQCSRDFPALPEDSFEVRNVPASLSDTLSPAFYLTPPLDDPHRNVIYINPYAGTAENSLYPTLAHEGYPGHLYQTAYFRNRNMHPLFSLLSCTGANEGWATYAEVYAGSFDQGLPPGTGPYLASQRALSLCLHGLLDIGIHYDGWTEDQVKEFLSPYLTIDEKGVSELMQVIIDHPANYLNYCAGYAEIMDMRREASEALGNDFSLSEFHKFFLDLGPVPFSVSRKYLKDWIRSQK